jgi:hypothetical protein
VKLKRGDTVEVLNAQTGEWMRLGMVTARWEEVNLNTGERSTKYDVDGEDKDGPFYGTWDADHIRLAVGMGPKVTA